MFPAAARAGASAAGGCGVLVSGLLSQQVHGPPPPLVGRAGRIHTGRYHGLLFCKQKKHIHYLPSPLFLLLFLFTTLFHSFSLTRFLYLFIYLVLFFSFPLFISFCLSIFLSFSLFFQLYPYLFLCLWVLTFC